MFVLDSNNHIVYANRVSHGIGSGNSLIPSRFSNRFNSHASSDGRFEVAELHQGAHGLAFRIKGLERKNSNAYARRIEIHRADYMDGNKYNFSWGCFAISDKDMDWYLKHIKPGTIIEVIP